MMNKITLVFATLLFLAACKDKKKNDPEPNPVVNQVSVKINGVDFSCSTCGNTYKSGGNSGVNFREGTSSHFNFFVTGFLKPGIYPLVPYGNPSFSYEKDGRYYNGRGSLTLNESDTSANGALKKFIGTFTCITDTSNGVFYKFSEGVLNIDFK